MNIVSANDEFALLHGIWHTYREPTSVIQQGECWENIRGMFLKNLF